MTQDDFRTAMNSAKREDRLLYVTDGTISAIALGYDSGTDEAVLFKGARLPLSACRVDEPPTFERMLAAAAYRAGQP